MQQSLSKREEEELYLRELDAVERARTSNLDFTLYTKPDYQINWHHQLVSYYLDEWVAGNIDRLMIFEPPRHGKSEQVSRRLPAYVLGRDPDAQIISASYSDDLASRMNRDVQRIIDSPLYRNIFPGTRLSGSNVRTVAQGNYLRNSDIFEIVGHSGSYRSAGVGGGITGMGGNKVIVDDPIKNAEQANSVVQREKIWEWWGSTLYTRLEKDASILLTLTRWHEDDLAGRLIKLMLEDPNAEQWVILSLPAIYEVATPYDMRQIGEALWPEKYDLARLQKIRSSIGSIFWNALYQQSPSAIAGNIFKRGDFKFWTQLPDRFDIVVQSWDMAEKPEEDNDWTVGQVWGKKGPDVYLLAQIRRQIGITDQIPAIDALTKSWPQSAYHIIIEDKSNGTPILQILKSKIPGIKPHEPQGSKRTRAIAVSYLVEAGNVYVPEPNRNPWVSAYLDELCRFDKAKNDDQVDATTQALLQLYQMELRQRSLETFLKL